MYQVPNQLWKYDAGHSMHARSEETAESMIYNAKHLAMYYILLNCLHVYYSHVVEDVDGVYGNCLLLNGELNPSTVS